MTESTVTKVNKGYQHKWIDADGEHHSYTHPTNLAQRIQGENIDKLVAEYREGRFVTHIQYGHWCSRAIDTIEALRAELEAVKAERRMISDHIRPLIPQDQNPEQADNVFGVIGYMVLERQRAETAEARLAKLEAELEAVKAERDEAVWAGSAEIDKRKAAEFHFAQLEAKIRRKDAALREARNAIWSGCDTISSTKAIDAALTRREG